ncbi:pantoate--beta-alanine ligase [bacterium]|nr:pantoate--beta-alanine ligase [bacterium]
MIIFQRPEEMTQWSRDQKTLGQRIGFVPTMGFLHPGHLSLVEFAKMHGRCTQSVMSIFVNPTQFGPNEDFEKYPRDFERDRKLAEQAGIDVLFYPSVNDIYGKFARTLVEVEDMGKVMCGITRPTHFRGVTTVVNKLFNIVEPHVAVFGQKDAQQFLIIKRMTQDLFMPVEVLMAPIIRENDGLAMSSRNIYLNPNERRDAVCLSQALNKAQEMIAGGEVHSSRLADVMRTHIEKHASARIDYIAIVDTENLLPILQVQKNTLIALAVYIGKTRLIDNIIIS